MSRWRTPLTILLALGVVAFYAAAVAAARIKMSTGFLCASLAWNLLYFWYDRKGPLLKRTLRMSLPQIHAEILKEAGARSSWLGAALQLGGFLMLLGSIGTAFMGP